MARGLKDKVVVITGASSGIGRAAAVAFAREGAAVVLAARRPEALREAAEEVLRAGGRAMTIETDVRDEGQVKRLAQRAIEAFDGIDIWINNAGVGHFSRFDETPPEIFAEVVHTTFFGTVHGTRAVLPHFQAKGAGIIINTVSIAGRLAVPFHSGYGAAKHAVMGFADSLRQELRDQPGIHICNVLPGPIDTPFWQHGANYSGQQIQAMQPAHSPEEVARIMLKLARKPQWEVPVGPPLRLMEMARLVAPHATDRMWAKMTEKNLFRNERRAKTSGSVMQPMSEGRGVHGGWAGGGKGDLQRARQSTGGTSTGGMGWAGLLALALPVGAALLYARSGGDRHQESRRPGQRPQGNARMRGRAGYAAGASGGGDYRDVYGDAGVTGGRVGAYGGAYATGSVGRDDEADYAGEYWRGR